ncbi:MAG: hypothetical protein E7K47_14850, partial [Acidovorax sp.]|nr:hypothetical protein [Acidovorax sp.]
MSATGGSACHDTALRGGDICSGAAAWAAAAPVARRSGERGQRERRVRKASTQAAGAGPTTNASISAATARGW